MNGKSVYLFPFIIILVLSIFTISLYNSNKGYEKFHSFKLMNDIPKVSYSFLSNQQAFKEILQSQTISLEQVEIINNNIYTIINFYESYSKLGIELKRYEKESYTLTNASFSIEAVFKRKIEEFEKSGIDVITLDEDFLYKVEYITEINQSWLDVLGAHLMGYEIRIEEIVETEERIRLSKNGIRNDFWIKILAELDKKALENNIGLRMLLN